MILCNAPSNARTCQIIQVLFKAIMIPILNGQIDCHTLTLFRNVVICVLTFGNFFLNVLMMSVIVFKATLCVQQ